MKYLLIMKDLIRQVLREAIESKYRRLSPELNTVIMKKIKMLFNSFKVDYRDPKKTYGNVSVEFCLNGKKVVDFRGDDEPGWDDYNTPEGTKIEPYGIILFDKKIVSQLTSTFNIRKSLALHLLTEFFEDNYLEVISQKYGIQFNNIDDGQEHDFGRFFYSDSLCQSEMLKSVPNYSREQILDYIESTGRGRTYWEEMDDEKLQTSFEQIWVIVNFREE